MSNPSRDTLLLLGRIDSNVKTLMSRMETVDGRLKDHSTRLSSLELFRSRWRTISWFLGGIITIGTAVGSLFLRLFQRS